MDAVLWSLCLPFVPKPFFSKSAIFFAVWGTLPREYAKEVVPMKRFKLIIPLASACLTLALSLPAAAKSRVPIWDHGFEVVKTVTPSTLVVQHASGIEQKLAVGNLSVQAAIYPASAGILRAGEAVTVFQEQQTPPLVIVHPEAFGTLEKSGTLWSLKSKRHGSQTLVSSKPELLGMREWQAGKKVMVFGQTLQDGKITAAALAAVPLVTRSTVQAVSADSLVLHSDQYGALTYSLKGVPVRFRQHFQSMSPGQYVIANLNPLNRQVLMVWPDHMERWAHTLERGSAGQVVAVSGSDITLTNHLGTVTIPISQQTTLQWQGHKDAKVSQISPGTRIIAVRERDGHLRIMVMGK